MLNVLQLLLIIGGVASITIRRPSVLNIGVKTHLQPGEAVYSFNDTKIGGYRYLSASDFFLANGKTITTNKELFLEAKSNVTLDVLEEGPEGTKVRVDLFIEIQQKVKIIKTCFGVIYGGKLCSGCVKKRQNEFDRCQQIDKLS